MRLLRSAVTSPRGLMFILIAGASLWLAPVFVAQAEVIRSFDVDIEIADDSSFVVTETIVHDFEGTNKHGIYRNIKDKHPPTRVQQVQGSVY